MKVSAFIRNFRRSKNKWIPRQVRAGGAYGPNATEEKFCREVILPTLTPYTLEEDGIKGRVTYEGKTFVITRTTKREYTPDWVVGGAGDTRYYEVKGAYKLGSEDRARLAWEIAAERNPHDTFYWAVLTRNGWEIEEWSQGGRRIRVKSAGESEYREAAPDWRRHRRRKAE